MKPWAKPMGIPNVKRNVADMLDVTHRMTSRRMLPSMNSPGRQRCENFHPGKAYYPILCSRPHAFAVVPAPAAQTTPKEGTSARPHVLLPMVR